MVVRVAWDVCDRAAGECEASGTQAVNCCPFELGAVDDFHVQETDEVIEPGNGWQKIGLSSEATCRVPVHRRFVRNDGGCLDDHKTTVAEQSAGNGKASGRREQ